MKPPELESTVHPLVESLKRSLSDYYARTFREELRNLTPVKVIPRPFSTVIFLQAESPGGVRKFVAKTVAHHPANVSVTRAKNQSVVEYEILSRLHARYHDVPRCSVPQPILVVPELETYIMGFVEGEVLVNGLRHARFFASPKRFEELCRHYFDCGTWLRHFQEFTGIRRGGPESFQSVLSRCRERLQRLEEAGAGRVPSGFCAAVEHWLDREVRELEGQTVEVAGRHGDFGPWNVIAGTDGITVIDFLGYTEEPLLIDVAQWLGAIADEEACFLNSSKRIARLRDQFLRGYAREVDFGARAFVICEAVQRIISMLTWVLHPGERIHRRWEARRLLKGHLRWFEAIGGDRPPSSGGSARLSRTMHATDGREDTTR
jgi:hypothetical protein